MRIWAEQYLCANGGVCLVISPFLPMFARLTFLTLISPPGSSTPCFCYTPPCWHASGRDLFPIPSCHASWKLVRRYNTPSLSRASAAPTPRRAVPGTGSGPFVSLTLFSLTCVIVPRCCSRVHNSPPPTHRRVPLQRACFASVFRSVNIRRSWHLLVHVHQICSFFLPPPLLHSAKSTWISLPNH